MSAFKGLTTSYLSAHHHMRRSVLPLCLLLCLAFWNSATAATSLVAQDTNTDGQAGQFDAKAALQISQSAIGRTLSDYSFLTSTGKKMFLSDFRGKPLVLSLTYTSCYHTCPMTTRFLAEVIEKAREALGEDSFEVAILGFDTENDTPGALRHYGQKQDINGKDWHLLSTDQSSIEKIAKELGFTYVPSPRGFDHVIQATVIDAKGEIYRQVYGEVFETPLLVEPLKQLVFGRPKPDQGVFSGIADKIRLFCTAYDPSRDAYVFDYSLFLGLAIGGMIIISTFIFIIRELLKGRKTNRI